MTYSIKHHLTHYSRLVSEMQDKLDQKILDILISPCRISIMHVLATNNGLSLLEIDSKVIDKFPDLNANITKLEKNELIKRKGDKYYLTDNGKEVYKLLQKIVKKANTLRNPDTNKITLRVY